MNDLVRALGISAGLLLSVVVVMILISFVTVTRGEASVAQAFHGGPDDSHPVKETAAAPAAKATKAAPATDEISVPLILALGIALFTLTIVALLGLSILQHLS